MEKIQLTTDDGSVEVEVVNKLGDVLGTFHYNPTDLDIIKRYEKVVDNLTSIDFKNDDFNEDEFFSLSNVIKEQFNYLLNGDVSETLFAKCNPFTPIADGQFYFADLLTKISDLNSKFFDKRINPDKVNKALAKYKA